MNLCSDEHDEICFEGRKCPLCSIRSDLKDTIASRETTIDELKEKIDQLEGEIAEQE